MSADKSEVLQGTLDMMILKTLHVLGPLHGFGIARRIEQVSEDVLTLNEGTVYTSLLRLQQQGRIESEWGTSENNRRPRFYSITGRGRTQLVVETENWEWISGVIGPDRLLPAYSVVFEFEVEGAPLRVDRFSIDENEARIGVAFGVASDWHEIAIFRSPCDTV